MSITKPVTICDHQDAVSFLTRLVIDLKKREMGTEYDPITMERLDEATRHIRDIQGCQSAAIICRARDTP